MKKSLRITALMLSLFMLSAGTITGCGTNKTVQENPTSTAATKVERPKLTIKWLGFNPPGNLVLEGTPVELELEKRYNIDIKPYQVDMSNADSVKVLIATGEMPDFFYINSANIPESYILGETLQEVPIDIVKTKTPNIYNSLMGSNEAKIGLNPFDITMVKGKNYGIPVFSVYNGAARLISMRSDWLDNLGVKENNLPDTLEGLEKLFLRFRNDDPDKNGQKDTYAYTFNPGFGGNVTPNAFHNVYGAFGILPGDWNKVDGKIVRGYVTEGYKKALKVLQSWYKQGIIDPDFATNKKADIDKKFAAGKLGVIEERARWHMDDPAGAWGMLHKEKPDVKVVIIAPPKGPDGKRGTGGGGTFTRAAAFGKTCTVEKRDRILEIFNDMYNPKDTSLYKLTSYGTEGENYKLEGDKISKIAEKSTNEGLAKAGAKYFGLDGMRDKVQYDLDIPKTMEWMFTLGMDRTKTFQLPNPYELFRSDIEAQYPDVLKIASEFNAKAIFGTLNIDAEWDAYVKKINDAGLTKLTEEINNAFKGK